MADAKSVMTPDPFMIGSGTSIVEAVDVYNSKSITSCPVINPMGELLGQLTDMDLMKALVHHKSQEDAYCKVIHAKELFSPLFYVNENDGLTEVIRQMVKSPTHRVLVRDKNEKVLGIISPKDVLHKLHTTDTDEGDVIEKVQELYKENEQLKERLTELHKYLKTYDSIFQSGLYMLHSVDKEGKIILANEKIHETLGYPLGEMVGLSIFDLYPADHHADARAGLKQVIEKGGHELTYTTMLKKDGTPIKIDLASAALKDEDGNFVGTFTVSREYGTEAQVRDPSGIFKNSSNKE